MKQETLSLDGFDYVCTALTSRKGLRVAARLARALAPGVAALTAAEAAEAAGDEGAAWGELLAPVLENPALEDTLIYLVDTFAEQTQCIAQESGNSQPLSRVIDTQFSDAYDTLSVWLAFNLKLSLSSFLRLGKNRAVLAAMLGIQLPSKSPTSAEKTGQSGASS